MRFTEVILKRKVNFQDVSPTREVSCCHFGPFLLPNETQTLGVSHCIAFDTNIAFDATHPMFGSHLAIKIVQNESETPS